MAVERPAAVLRKETSSEKRAAARRAEAVGRLLDESVRVPVIGYRIGLDPILGIVPVAGDSVATVASLYIVFLGLTVGVPLGTVVRMALLVAVDGVLGSVPVLGTLVDAVLKVNKRNAATIRRHVESTA